MKEQPDEVDLIVTPNERDPQSLINKTHAEDRSKGHQIGSGSLLFSVLFLRKPVILLGTMAGASGERGRPTITRSFAQAPQRRHH